MLPIPTLGRCPSVVPCPGMNEFSARKYSSWAAASSGPSPEGPSVCICPNSLGSKACGHWGAAELQSQPWWWDLAKTTSLSAQARWLSLVRSGCDTTNPLGPVSAPV